jgi:hypothetical protein
LTRNHHSYGTQLYDLPCRDCGDTVRVRLRTGRGGTLVPVFCNACLTARIKAIQGERRPQRTVKQQRKSA